MDSPLGGRTRDVSIIEAGPEHAQEQVIILVSAQALVKTTDSLESSAADQRGRWLNDNALAENRSEMAFGVFQARMRHVRPADHLAVAIYVIEVAISPAERRPFVMLERLDKRFQVVRIPDVILIQQRDQRAFGMRDAEVARG